MELAKINKGSIIIIGKMATFCSNTKHIRFHYAFN